MPPDLVLFDFCETLVPFQTADAFVDYVRESLARPRMHRWERLLASLKQYRVLSLLNRLFPYGSVEKRIKLFQLRGITRAEMDTLAKKYYAERLRPVLIDSMLAELLTARQRGMEVAVVSGGYGIYLQHFVEEFEINALLAAEIEFDSRGFCTGRISGKDCLYHYKVEKLENRFGKNAGKLRSAIAYSDSITDLPMLLWAAEAVVVSKGQSQVWAGRYGFREMLW